ncbi:MAG: hypothetical protein ACJAWL_002374 [Motiliproteus sp.]|jgi:hypothetical protein
MVDNTGLDDAATAEPLLNSVLPGRCPLLSRLGRWGLFLGCGLLLGYAVFSRQPPPLLFAHADKVGHLLGFAALAVSARLALLSCPWKVLWGGLLVTAVALESLQHLVSPLRQFSLEDMAANLAGVLLGGVVCWWAPACRHLLTFCWKKTKRLKD